MISDRGKQLQKLVETANAAYFNRGIAWAEYIETATAKRTEAGMDGKPITKVQFKALPHLDYRGLFYAGGGFDFDCKECAEGGGLPLKDIRETQIHFFRIAQAFNLCAFLIVYSSARNQYYRVDCRTVLYHWDLWKINPGRRGLNRIPFGGMLPITQRDGIALDYLDKLYSPAGPRANMDEYNKARYRDGER